MNRTKRQYLAALKERNLVLSFCARVKKLVFAVSNKVCRPCNYSYNCKDNYCIANNAKMVNLLGLQDVFAQRLLDINEDIESLKEALRYRFQAKRIAKLNKKARKSNPLGSWIHIFNQRVSNWTKYINDFSKISGEVCVSRETDYQFAYRRQFIGVKIEGQLTAQWNFDCWSKILVNGKRWGTKNGGSHRSEGWIIPANSKITAIVCAKPSKEVLRISRELNLDIEILDQTHRNDW